ncbi:MAG: hypothetical protein HQ528_09195 [Candidatus Marinimicrobia bacterium]|nr:hypothetical protein [Candidatus Neomarinimicrobiota bacterium]
MKYLNKIFTIMAVLVILIPGCRKVYTPSDLELTEYAWELYEAGNYIDSYTWFREAMVVDSVYQDARNGLGWSFGKLNQIDSSRFYFIGALQMSQPRDITANVRHEIWAGLTFANQAAGQDSLAIIFGDSLISDITDVIVSSTAVWNFSHDADLNHLDLKLSLATANYNLGQFGLAKEHIISILAEADSTSTFNADTASVQGQMAIAAELEILRELLD